MSRSHNETGCRACRRGSCWKQLRKAGKQKRERSIAKADERERHCACSLRQWCEVCVMQTYSALFEDDDRGGCQCPLPLDECIEQHELEWRRFAANQNDNVRVPVIPKAS
jgi:hypothetical protein